MWTITFSKRERKLSDLCDNFIRIFSELPECHAFCNRKLHRLAQKHSEINNLQIAPMTNNCRMFEYRLLHMWWHSVCLSMDLIQREPVLCLVKKYGEFGTELDENECNHRTLNLNSPIGGFPNRIPKYAQKGRPPNTVVN